jgi:hypothetical protein
MLTMMECKIGRTVLGQIEGIEWICFTPIKTKVYSAALARFDLV